MGHQQRHFYFVGINSYVFNGKLKQGLDKFRTLFLFELFLKSMGYRTFCVDFNTDEVRHCLASSVFYPFPKKIKGGQNELVKSPKMIAMTALIRVISF